MMMTSSVDDRRKNKQQGAMTRVIVGPMTESRQRMLVSFLIWIWINILDALLIRAKREEMMMKKLQL